MHRTVTRRTLWLIALLVAATAGTLGWRWAVVGGVTDVEARQRAALARTLDHVQRSFQSMTADLVREARHRAADPALVRALARRQAADPGIEPELVQITSDWSLADLHSVEVYDPTPRILAWNGFAMPMDDGPGRADFLSREQVLLVRDGSRRTALVAWAPVTDEGRVVGAVRALRFVERKMPVNNEYLRDYSLQDEWTRTNRQTVLVRHAGETDEGPAPDTVVLASPSGEPLLVVEAVPPSVEETVRLAVVRIDIILSVWITLLLALVVWHAASRLRRARTSLWRHTILFAGVLWAGRFALIAMDVPNRWQTGKDPLSPLFDTAHLASAWGAGLVGSIGDLLVTALFAVGFSLVVAEAVFRKMEPHEPRGGPGQSVLVGLAFGSAGAVLFWIASSTSERALLDSTLAFFARSGLLPPRLVVVVFGSLLIGLFAMWMLAAVLARVTLSGHVRSTSRDAWIPALVSAVVAMVAVIWMLDSASWPILAAMLLFQGSAVHLGAARYRADLPPIQAFTARGVLFGVVALSIVLYPVLERGYEVERRARMLDAAQSFAEDRDTRVLFAVESALDDTRSSLAGQTHSASLDSLLEERIRGSLVASLGTFEVSASVLEGDGRTLARTGGTRTPAVTAALAERDGDDLDLLRGIGEERGIRGMVVEKLTSPIEFDRFDYVGAAPVNDDTGRWVLVRAAQHEHLPAGSTPFPRVLVPAGYYGNQYPDLSIAEFRDDVIVRSFGASFGRSYLDPQVVGTLRSDGSLWRRESLRDRRYVTYYATLPTPDTAFDGPALEMRTIAVRQAAVNIFDRLYFLLRLTVSGLVVGLVVYLVGLVLRRRAGLLPAPRRRFRDRVLNAFFAVGLVTVAAMGALGLRVITGENDRAVESWLKQHLERVEDALVQDARGDELPYRALERTDIDSLAARVGLDLNVYRGFELASTSRTQLARDRLIGMRLPIEAYRSLFVDGYRFVDVDERLGTFEYTAGYRSLPDEQGVPRYVISVPTLPEQERIEEERARTVAYLFGALLLLVLVVMATAALIANALALPVARLRRGLERVAGGRFDRIQPLETRDELAELVGSFNTMLDQLAESRRLLALQERQLAWREMARQVAHEIKNPLTPMKLSVQQLQRAWAQRREDRPFEEELGKKTATLIDQIDALARIANEFSNFARLPMQELEPVDLNRVVSEAADLMRAHSAARIDVELSPGPLPVDADREALRRVFINFVKNAVEAVPEETRGVIQITTASEEDPETGLPWAVARVRDNGAGIPEDLREKIFTPSFSTKTSGTGLGLAIARNTVEELRGRIGFDTREGDGSEFWVRIPIRQEEDSGPV